MKKLTILFVAAISTFGCAQHSKAPEGVEIAGSTTMNGKGVPYGRSDSQEPYAKLKGISEDPNYGYSKENPIRVGIGDIRFGSASEKYFLNALLSETGRPIEFERIGSCCHFETTAGGIGLLDVFTITVPERKDPITLYLNMYDPVTPIAPKGFSLRYNQIIEDGK